VQVGVTVGADGFAIGVIVKLLAATEFGDVTGWVAVMLFVLKINPGVPVSRLDIVPPAGRENVV